jgi:adenylate kinase
MRNIVILLGPPASGKGTQSELLKKDFGYIPISTGFLLRNEIATNSELGKNISNLIDKGSLVSDEIIFDVLSKKINENKNSSFVIDGFPRTLGQAILLSEYLSKSNNLVLKKVLIFELTEEEVLYRIKNRITCKKCGAVYNLIMKKPKVDSECDFCHSTELSMRNDDLDIESIVKRVKIFNSTIGDIKKFYKKKDLIFLIDALESVKGVNEKIISILND